MAEQDLDRGHAATPYKLAEARKKGSVAKSQDLATVALLGVAIVWCHAFVAPVTHHWARLQHRWWAWDPLAPLDAHRAAALMNEFVVALIALLAPLCLSLMLVALISQWAQTGPIFTSHPLKPDFNRLNPAEGLKRLFSMKTVYLALKSSLKLLVLAAVFWWAFEALIHTLMGLSWLPAKLHATRYAPMFGSLITKLWLVLLVLALVDLLYMRWEFARQMRMSARDLKDEVKHREGDPRIKRRLRELRIERLRQSQAAGKVAGADVLVTNPTRIAVAVRYDGGRHSAPELVAKGAGGLARKMRDVAWRHGVPIVQNPPLARALYRQARIGGAIPSEWYPVLAKILVWVYASREKRKEVSA